ncbi:ROK family protein [Actinoplanes sp. NPDC051513]|uniref:ROK family protein n=1 Tax=Actinoplanes sp. NPDC051513 TaxID=3363908 RepID=UPI0037A03DCE
MSNHVVVALDVGGTGMKCALVRPDGTVYHEERHPTLAARGPGAVTENILQIADGLAGRARSDGLDPVAVGIAVPGVVDEENGVAVWSSNVGFRDVPVRQKIEERLGLPAALGHDVRVGGIAEARLGAGRGEKHVLFAAIGTGIAAALVVNGVGYNGAHGAAGELGHIIVRPGGAPCPCGAGGCLEAIASARAIGARYAELSGNKDATAFDVVNSIDTDKTARRVWHEAIEALADGLITAQALFDVSVLVLGGGLAEAGDTLLTPLTREMEKRLTFHRMPKIVKAALGDTAGCKGAALLALDHLEQTK